MVVAIDVNVVAKSLLSKDTISIETPNIAKNTTIYALTPFTVSVGTVCPSIFITLTRLGYNILLTSFLIIFMLKIIRETLRPPPVLPAHAPINMSITSIT